MSFFKKTNKPLSDDQLSWRQLFGLYKKIKIPWLWMIVVALLAIGLKEVNILYVPYQTKIMTGAIGDHGFLVGFLVLSSGTVIMEALQGGINELTAAMTTRNASHAVWGRLVRLPMKFYRGRDQQEFVSRITQDTTGVFAALAVLINIISVAFAVAAAWRRMYATYKMLALIMLSGIPLLILSAWIVGKMQYRINYIQNSAIAKMTGFFAERLPSLMHIKTSNMEDKEYQRGAEANHARYRMEIKAEVYQVFLGPVQSLAQTLNQIVLLLVATALVRQGTMEMYQLVNLYNYYILFMGNSIMLIGLWQSVKHSHGSSTMIAKVLDAEPEDLEGGASLSESPETISFEHVSFSYDGTTPILRDVSFVIPKGKTTVIIGENGSGKSTIVKLLERFEDPDAGDIRIGGRKIEEVNLEGLRDQLGYLFQGNQIVKGTIRDNILYGIDRECTEEEIEQAARTVNAYDFIVGKEDGFDTEISRFDNKVSGGEMQRIAAARMILKDPQYLIMDEATSGIDLINARQVMEGLSEVMKDKTIIMVSHDIEAIRKADNIVALNRGVVEACGDYDTVYENSELLRRFAAA